MTTTRLSGGKAADGDRGRIGGAGAPADRYRHRPDIELRELSAYVEVPVTELLELALFLNSAPKQCREMLATAHPVWARWNLPPERAATLLACLPRLCASLGGDA